MPVIQIFQHRVKRNLLLLAGLFLLSGLTIASDYFYANWQGTGFYIEESLLFSSFWICFFPLLNLQFKFLNDSPTLLKTVLTIASLTIVHLFLYPFLVWIGSSLMFGFSFPYWRTFNFGITEHLVKALIIYSIPFPLILYYKKKFKLPPIEEKSTEIINTGASLSSLLITDSHGNKIVVEIKDIAYFSSKSPYVEIHLANKKHLYTTTLKNLEAQINSREFIRIHKSFIVNLNFITSYRSRNNGDYDLILKNEKQLRLSRNYAAAFKKKWQEFHSLN